MKAEDVKTSDELKKVVYRLSNDAIIAIHHHFERLKIKSFVIQEDAYDQPKIGESRLSRMYDAEYYNEMTVSDYDETKYKLDDVPSDTLISLLSNIENTSVGGLIEFCFENEEPSFLYELLKGNEDTIDFGDIYEGKNFVELHEEYPYMMDDDMLKISKVQRYILTSTDPDVVKDLLIKNKVELSEEIKEEFNEYLGMIEMGIFG